MKFLFAISVPRFVLVLVLPFVLVGIGFGTERTEPFLRNGSQVTD
jgi:hypothetical protein